MFCVQCGCPLGPEQANHPQAIQNALSAATEDIAIQQTDLRAFSSSRLPLFPVATHKFIVLSICTLGIYELYWCYQNWKRIKAASRPHQGRIRPETSSILESFLRTALGIFTFQENQIFGCIIRSSDKLVF